MASTADERNSGGGAKPERASPTAEEWKFLSCLFHELATEGPAIQEALLRDIPDWVEHLTESDGLRQRIRAALLGHPGVELSKKQQALSEQTKASLARYRATARPAGVLEEHRGVLTSVTRKLSPEKALQLYRKITPIVVHQVLSIIDPSANLGVVRRLVEHMCSAEVQLRLRSCEHVRDGILDEICAVLERRPIHRQVTREELQRVLEECGAVDDLMAMANCIKLAATKAS